MPCSSCLLCALLQDLLHDDLCPHILACLQCSDDFLVILEFLVSHRAFVGLMAISGKMSGPLSTGQALEGMIMNVCALLEGATHEDARI